MEKARDVQPVKGVVISRESLRRQDLLTPCLWGIFLSGVVIGAGRTGEELSDLTRSFLEVRAAGDWQQAFLSALLSASGMLALLLVSGFCAVGQPAVLTALRVRGMGIGGCMGELYRQLGAGGIGCVLLLAVPEAVCACCFLQGSRSALRMSGKLFLTMLSSDAQPLQQQVRRYGVKFFLLFLLILMAAGLSGLCTGLLGPLLCGS